MENDKSTPPSGQTVQYTKRKAHRTSYVMYPADEELLDGIVEYLGCTRSEAMRTALRSFAMHLAYLRGKYE